MHSFKIFSPPPFLFVQPKESSISKERQLMSKRSPSHAHTLIKNLIYAKIEKIKKKNK